MSAHDWGDLADDATAAALLNAAMSTLDNVAEYGDARLIECGGAAPVRQLGPDPDERIEQNIGIGVRVLVDGQWGFAARPLADARRRRDGAARRRTPRPSRWPAAAARSRCRPGSRSAAATRRRRRWTRSPWTPPPGTTCWPAWLGRGQRPTEVAAAQAGVNAKRQHRHFASTEGSRQHQHLLETGAMLVVTAAGHGDVQRRSYPNSFHGNTAGAGWEYLAGLAMRENAARVGEEAVALLTAPLAPRGHADVVIGAQQVSLQIHESAGHALELDRILGDEAQLRRHLVHHGRRRRLAALRLGRGHHRLRPDRARHPGQLRVRRRGHPGPPARR